MKKLCFLLSVLIICISFCISSSLVQAQSKPTVPEFTVKIVDTSYDVPPTQSTDPYTGTVTNPGYHVEQSASRELIRHYQ